MVNAIKKKYVHTSCDMYIHKFSEVLGNKNRCLSRKQIVSNDHLPSSISSTAGSSLLVLGLQRIHGKGSSQLLLSCLVHQTRPHYSPSYRSPLCCFKPRTTQVFLTRNLRQYACTLTNSVPYRQPTM